VRYALLAVAGPAWPKHGAYGKEPEDLHRRTGSASARLTRMHTDQDIVVTGSAT